MIRRTDIIGGVTIHHQPSVHVTSAVSGAGVTHTMVNGVSAPWPVHLSTVTPPGVAPLMSSHGGAEAVIERMMTSRLIGVASLLSGMTMATATTAAVLLLGAPAFFLISWVPATLLLGVGALLSVRGRPSRRGVSENQVLESAQRRGGLLTVATLALDTGGGLSECQKTLDAMVAAGWVTIDVNDEGSLTYRIAALEPERAPRSLPVTTSRR